MTIFIIRWLFSSFSAYLTFLLFKWAESEGGLPIVLLVTCLGSTSLLRIAEQKIAQKQFIARIRGR